MINKQLYLLLLDISNFIPSCDTIAFVSKFNLADNLMIECTQESIVKHVTLIIESNLPAVLWEINCLLTDNL